MSMRALEFYTFLNMHEISNEKISLAKADSVCD